MLSSGVGQPPVILARLAHVSLVCWRVGLGLVVDYLTQCLEVGWLAISQASRVAGV